MVHLEALTTIKDETEKNFNFNKLPISYEFKAYLTFVIGSYQLPLSDIHLLVSSRFHFISLVNDISQ